MHHGRLRRASIGKIVVSVCFQIVDDIAVHELPVHRCLCLIVNSISRIDPLVSAIDDEVELPVDPIIVPLRGVVDSGYPRYRVNVSKAKAFFGVLLCDRQWMAPRTVF